MRLVLASASPRRAEILRSAGIEFVVDSADIDESAVTGGPAEVASQLAVAKARAVAERHPGEVALGADTVVELGGELIGKPVDGADAPELLRRLAGRDHRVTSGVAVVTGSRALVDTETTVVRMRRYTEEEIELYVESGMPLDKAGAYGIQDRPFAPAESISGCYLNVVGLPLCLASRLLKSVGALDHSMECPSHDTVTAAV